jgi:hypothetical protein
MKSRLTVLFRAMSSTEGVPAAAGARPAVALGLGRGRLAAAAVASYPPGQTRSLKADTSSCVFFRIRA